MIMLFLLKRHWQSSLAALFILTLLGLALRFWLDEGPAFACSADHVDLGVGVLAFVLASDVTLHGLFCISFGERYRRRHRELAGVFRDQGLAAILAGALMAGVGEELVFRGVSVAPGY